MEITRTLLAAVALALALSGCGDGGGGNRTIPSPAAFVDIASDASVDGDVDENRVVTVGAGSVLAGIHPVTALEHRAFFTFPLDPLPLNAIIQAATLELLVVDLVPRAPTSFRVELVSFPPPPEAVDFSVLPIEFDTFTFFPADVGTFVALDVTPLVFEADRRGFADAQFRLSLDPLAPDGFVEIDDPLADLTRAPILHIDFF